MKGARIRYSADEMTWLEANFKMVISDYHRAFVSTFGREDISVSNLNQLRKRKGWKVGRERGRYVGRLRMFSDPEIAWLRQNSTLPIGEYCAAFQAEFNRQDVTEQKLHALRKRQGWKTGRTGQFAKGSTSWNVGKRMPFNPNSARTQFKPGNLPHNTKYLGHERVNVDGYVEISIERENPHTGFERTYVHKQHYLWELANGQLPEGHVLKCLDGNKQNCDPANWEAIPQALMPLLNGGKNGRLGLHFDSAPAELKPTILTVAKLKHAVKGARERLSKREGGAA